LGLRKSTLGTSSQLTHRADSQRQCQPIQPPSPGVVAHTPGAGIPAPERAPRGAGLTQTSSRRRHDLGAKAAVIEQAVMKILRAVIYTPTFSKLPCRMRAAVMLPAENRGAPCRIPLGWPADRDQDEGEDEDEG
jgi:hypothetical protein